jgi:hypothetical protein
VVAKQFPCDRCWTLSPKEARAPLFAQNYPALPDHTVGVGASQTVSIDNGTNKRSATQVGFNQLRIPEISPIETDLPRIL